MLVMILFSKLVKKRGFRDNLILFVAYLFRNTYLYKTMDFIFYDFIFAQF